MSRLAASVVLVGVALVGVTAPAFATKGPGHKELICHPVNGKGQTGTGWTLVDVDKASSHFDKDGNPKHQSHDGRVDTYAVDGACPVVPSTPTPTTTGGTPSPSPSTQPTGHSTSSTTAPPAPSPSSTSQHPSPSQTSLTPTGTTGTPSSSPSSDAPPQKSAIPAAASTKPSSPTSVSPRRSVPSSTVAPPELARTGFTGEWVFAAALLLLVGAWFIRISRKGGAHR